MGINDLSSTIENVNKIKNSKIISKRNKINLILLFIVHWIFLGGIATYIIWRQPKYDKYILFCIVFLIITWKIYDNCLVSYYEQEIIKDVLNINKIRNPSLNFYCNNNNITVFIEIIVSFIMNFNFAYIMLSNNFYPIFVLIFLIWSLYVTLYHRHIDLLKNYELKKNVRF